MDQQVLLLCDTMLQYTMNMLRAFNVDEKLTDSQWKSGIKAMQTWNNEIIKEECHAIRRLDSKIDKLILHAIENYKFGGGAKVKIEDLLPNFLNTLSKSHQIADRSVFDLNYTDLGTLFRRITRRSLYLTSQSLTPNDSISQVLFRDRSGALSSWRTASGKSKKKKVAPPSLLSAIEEPISVKDDALTQTKLRASPPSVAALPVPDKIQSIAKNTFVASKNEEREYSEVTRCFEKLI